jgi:hypothetical protein
MAEFSKKLQSRATLREEEYAYLESVFQRLSTGEDPAAVLGLKYGRGQSAEDALHRQALHLVIHWIECATQPVDADPPGLGYSVAKACEEGSKILKRQLAIEDPDAYDASYVRKCYYNPKYQHMRRTMVGAFDSDSPYES